MLVFFVIVLFFGVFFSSPFRYGTTEKGEMLLIEAPCLILAIKYRSLLLKLNKCVIYILC